ncbi:MAG: toll/interleukin-1 receptor domain-containing protein, partial [Alphaproteobacteria bacterium]
MTKIFISYRRQDTLPIAGRIYDRLSGKFGAERVFMDIDSIPYGVDFQGWLDGEVSKASIVLALIGAGWIDARDEMGRRRLDNPDDFVRIEIESALRRDIPLIPVLIGGAPMPKAGELPETLRPLARRHAAFVDMARDFHMHMDRLINGLEW